MSFDSYKAVIKKTKLLDAETELALARAWRDHGDEKALHCLVASYLRFAINAATQYRRYGIETNELIQEASVGLMKAAERYDPELGYRFSTYARWWIKATIQDYIIRNYSSVRLGKTGNQKKLFFNLRRVQVRLERERSQASPAEIREAIAAELGCPLRDVELMSGRLAGPDYSLNTLQGEEGREWLESLEDYDPRAEEIVCLGSDTITAREWLVNAFVVLTPRERMIVAARKLADKPETHRDLGRKLGISYERVRQLEAQALRKLKKHLEARYGDAVRDLVTTR